MKSLVFFLILLGFQSHQRVKARDSPVKRELDKIHASVCRVLERDEISDEWLRSEITNNFTKRQMAEMAKICHVFYDAAGTDDPKGTIEDHQRLRWCFSDCVELLRKAKAIPELRDVYFALNLYDGDLRDWIWAAGEDWRKFLMISEE